MRVDLKRRTLKAAAEEKGGDGAEKKKLWGSNCIS